MTDREVWIRRLRRAALVALAVASMGLAVAMIWIALSPGFVRLTPTLLLLGILSLLVLPGVTVGAWYWDRSILLRTRKQDPEDLDAMTRDRTAPVARPPTAHPAGRSIGTGPAHKLHTPADRTRC